MSAKIYHIPLPPPEDRNEAIDYLNIIVQRTQNYLYKMEGMAQANAVLARKNSSMMSQLAQMTATMNTIQTQLSTLSAGSTNSTILRRKYYYLICVRLFSHGSKENSLKKPRHKDGNHYKERLGGNKKGRE